MDDAVQNAIRWAEASGGAARVILQDHLNAGDTGRASGGRVDLVVVSAGASEYCGFLPGIVSALKSRASAVLVARSQQRVRRVVAGVPRNSAPAWMTSVMDVVRWFDGELTLVHALEPGRRWSALGSVPRLQGVALAGRGDDERQAMRCAESWVSGAVAAGLRPPRVLMRPGAPAQVIAKVATDLEANLIVVGSSQDSRDIGQVAACLVKIAPCSVLVMKRPFMQRDDEPRPPAPGARVSGVLPE